MRGGGCSENVSWQVFALAIQGRLVSHRSRFLTGNHFKVAQRKARSFLFYPPRSIKCKSNGRQGSNLKPYRFMTVKVRSGYRFCTTAMAWSS